MPKIRPVTETSTPEEKEQLAMKLIKWLVKHNLFQDIYIYVNDKRYASDVYQPKLETKTIHDPKISPEPFYVQEDVDAKDYIEYANPNLITMSFEGPLYHALNYSDGKIYEELQTFFNKYGLYFELGYAWSLSTYKN